MDKNGEIFYSKLMLFGEYSVILGSMALTVPYGHFKGELSFINEDKYTDLNLAVSSNKVLQDYIEEARQGSSSGKVEEIIDLDLFEKDVADGLYFESTIPQGYGLGSSGALTAAVYKRYGREKSNPPLNTDTSHLEQYKERFSILEAYFHGSSSGIDPLCSYIKSPLLIKNNKEISTVGIPKINMNSPGGIFLIDTGRPRKTQHLVNDFMKQMQDKNFMNKFNDYYVPWTNNCITSLTNGELDIFARNLALLSRFQLINMKKVVTSGFSEVWEEGLSSGEYSLKLCGSGGGGFILGFANNLEKVTRKLQKTFQVITVYKNNGRFF